MKFTIAAMLILLPALQVLANANAGLPPTETESKTSSPDDRFAQGELLCADSIHPTAELASFYFSVGGDVRAVRFSKNMESKSISPFTLRNGGIYFTSQSRTMRVATVSPNCGRALECSASYQYGQSATLCAPTMDSDVQITNRIVSEAHRVEIQYCGYLRIKPTRVEIIRYRGVVDFTRGSQSLEFPYIQDVQVTDCPTH